MKAQTWTLRDSATPSNGATQVDFTDLGEMTELMLIMNNLSKTGSASFQLRVSSDNGSSFYATTSDYNFNVTSVTDHTSLSQSTTNPTRSQHYFPAFGQRLSTNGHVGASGSTGCGQKSFLQPDLWNAIRVLVSANAFNGTGTIEVWGR